MSHGKYVIAANDLDETQLSTLEMLNLQISIHQRRARLSLSQGPGKPTHRPTARRMFQMMEGVDMLTIEQGCIQQQLVLNLTAVGRPGRV